MPATCGRKQEPDEAVAEIAGGGAAGRRRRATGDVGAHMLVEPQHVTESCVGLGLRDVAIRKFNGCHGCRREPAFARLRPCGLESRLVAAGGEKPGKRRHDQQTLPRQHRQIALLRAVGRRAVGLRQPVRNAPAGKVMPRADERLLRPAEQPDHVEGADVLRMRGGELF
jgi:hypothetical protein